jgi:hypothetical protein
MFSPPTPVQGASAHGPRFQSQDLESRAHVQVYKEQLHKYLDSNIPQLRFHPKTLMSRS